jgi:murein DD-endopeptidase MepM/ murein hydrolase activator NlpD
LLASLPAESFLCWDEPVFSVSDGVVTAIGDGWPDRLRVNLVTALFAGYLGKPRVSAEDLRPLAGNYIVIRGETAVAFYAHLRLGTTCVHPGEEVRTGQIIGRVGNSGNSTMPHLHFHMMDQPDPERALGIPCCFRRYERFRGGEWELVDEGVPAKLERIRWPAPSNTPLRP